MRAAVLGLALAACGGGGGQQAATPVPPAEAPPQPKRVIVEDDSEPEDGVEVIGGRGRMEQAVIEAGIAPHTTSMSECYTTRVGKRRWLGGRILLHWDIKKTGEISAVKLAESNLGSWPVEKCLLEVARAATFGKPIGGDADFSLPLDFSARGGSATWDEDMALRAVGGQLAALDECVDPDKAAAANGNGKAKPKGPLDKKDKPKRIGKLRPPDDVTITVYVGPQGKAQSVGFSSPRSVLDDDWADCAERTAMAWRLPDPRGQVAKLAIRYRAR